MAANTSTGETCGSCCKKLKDLVKSYEVELGLDEDNDGTKVHAFGSLNFCLEQNKFNDLLNNIRTKCLQCRGWPDATRAVRASMERLQQVEYFAPVKNVLSECLEKLQNAMRDTSPKDVVQRLEAISKQIGLKFYDSGTGTDCFISSDMFYVEVQMEHTGKVTEVKVAQAGEPESCPELTKILQERQYDEFINHLKGLSDLYRLSGDTFQKSKIMMSLKAVEIDINMIDALHGPVENAVDTILHSPVGFVTPRQGGRLMRLTYFASPYQLLDIDNPGETLQFTRESPPPLEFGHWVSVSVEQSHKCLLPTMPLIEDPTETETLDVEIKYQALNDNNSDELPASFVLKLNKPMVMSAHILGKIYQTINRGGNFTHCSKVPVDKLLIREWLKENKLTRKEHGLTCFVALPEQYHVYHVNEAEGDAERLVSNTELGLLVYRIPFTRPSHIPDIIQLLRRQATYNTLLTSVLRSTEPLKKDETSEKYVFEVSASGPFTVTVAFENPCIPGMASVDFTVQEDHHVTATLHTASRNSAFCRDEYITRVIQRCISIPVTMRSVIKKAASFKPGEQSVIGTSQEMNSPFGNPVPDPSSKWMTLNIPPEGLFTVMKTPTDPPTPSLFNTSPTFAFSLETPSPTVTVFPFASISPSGTTSFPFTSTEGELTGTETTPATGTSKQDENKPLETPRLKITLKRKRDNEYVIENSEIPKSEGIDTDQGKMGSAEKVFAEAMEDDTLVEAASQSYGGVGSVGPSNISGTFSFQDTPVVSSVTGQLMTSIGQTAAGSVISPDATITVTSTPVAPGSDLVGMVTTENLFDIPGSSGSGVEGILQNLPGGVSHLPPGIVPVSGSMDFDVGLDSGMAEMHVPVDAAFDFDTAIDASGNTEPGIGGAAGVVPPNSGSFDVDAMLSFDLDQIAPSGTLPGGAITTDVTDPGDESAGLMGWGQDLSDSMLGLDTGAQGLGEGMDGSGKS